MALQLVETGYTLGVIERESGFNFAVTYNTKLMASTVFASLAQAFPCADGSCTLRSALFLSTWRTTWLLFFAMEDEVFNASPLLFQF